jgi:hypothetical protein
MKSTSKVKTRFYHSVWAYELNSLVLMTLPFIDSDENFCKISVYTPLTDVHILIYAHSKTLSLLGMFSKL